MASLENKKIKDTYEGLLKTDDNAAIDGAVEITDGAGNGTGVTISNDGQVTATGTVSFGSLKDTGEDITVTKFVDEADGIGNNDNDTSIPTSAAVKDYVDTNVTAQDLDFQGDTGTGAVDLDSQTLDIAGGTGIDTSAVDQTLTVNIDSTVATLSDTQTLTNKTVDADNNTVSNLEVDNLKSGVLDTDLTSVSASDDTLASAKAIKTYVDSNITAQDLDITDGTTTSAVDLDSQTLTIEGTTNEVEVSLTDQTFTVGLPTSITTNVTGNLTGNVTGDLTGNADTASALETARTISLSGDVAGSVSFDGSANADITATIQANSVALGTDTTGDYVENLGTGTGVTIGSNTGEGSSPTISVDYGSTANTAVQGNTSLTIQGTANEIEVTDGGVTLGSGGTVTVGLPDDVSLGGSLTIAQNLTVNGTTTTVNTDTLSVEDPLIELARDNSENSVDVGLYGKYSLDSGVTTKYSGLFKDASDSDKFKLFKGLEVEPTSTVDTSGTGYTKGDLVINDLDAVTISGTISTAAQTNITSVGTLSSLTVSGDLTVDTNTLYVNSSNNRVGIGTASPSDNLEVNGAIRIADQYELKFGGTTASIFGSSSLNQLRFYTNNSERLRIDSSGNVGIGTSSPTAKTDIRTSASSGATNEPTFRAFGYDTDSYFEVNNNANNSANIKLTRSDAATMFSIDGHSGTTFFEGNVGIGTTSPSRELEVTGAGNVYIKVTAPTDNDSAAIELSNTQEKWTIANSDTNDDALEFRSDTNGDSLVIKKTGEVGIGTSSPDHILCLEDTEPTLRIFDSSNTLNQEQTIAFGTEPGNRTHAEISSVNTNTGNAEGELSFKTNSGASLEERMRIDSSGNVGIGITPSYDLHLHSTLTGVSDSSDFAMGVTSNDSETTPRVLFQAQKNGTNNGRLVISTLSGGSLSERMRIDSSGNVGIGTTSPSSLMHISKSTSPAISNSDLQGIKLTNTSTSFGGSGIGIELDAGNGDVNAMIAVRADGNDNSTEALFIATTTSDPIIFATNSGGTDITTNERMRIDSSGNVGIGTSSPSFPLHVVTDSGTYEVVTIQNGSSAALFRAIGSGGGSVDFGAEVGTADTAIIRTGSTERMRITSAGRIHFYNLLGSSATQSDVRYDTTSKELFYNTSSERYKTDIVDLENTLDKVNSLRSVRYKDIETEQETTGLIAEEVIEIIPEVVFKKEIEGFDEPQPEGINYSDFAPFLIKAIQEQQDIINELKTRIETLENN